MDAPAPGPIQTGRLAPRRARGTLRLVRWVPLALLAVLAGLPACSTRPETDRPAPATPPTTRVEHVDASAAAALLARGNVVILDLRTPAEYHAGHLREARLIDFTAPDFAEQLARLDRNRSYLVHCATGRRSTRALETFQRLGFKHVIHLDGGLRAWKDAGQPVVP